MQTVKSKDISEDAYKRLTKVFYPHIVEFFADPKNQEDYEKDRRIRYKYTGFSGTGNYFQRYYKRDRRSGWIEAGD